VAGGLVLENLDVGLTKESHPRELSDLEGAEFAITPDEGATHHGRHAVFVTLFQGDNFINFA
jgi:hypothetical protein